MGRRSHLRAIVWACGAALACLPVRSAAWALDITFNEGRGRIVLEPDWVAYAAMLMLFAPAATVLLAFREHARTSFFLIYLLALILLTGIVLGEVGVAAASVALLAGGAAAVIATRASDLLMRGDRVELESHWGGLGGGLGGWRLSPAAGLVLLALVFLGTAVGALIGGRASPPSPESNTAATTSSDPAAAAKDARSGPAKEGPKSPQKGSAKE
jgi:hypothetical protein